MGIFNYVTQLEISPKKGFQRISRGLMKPRKTLVKGWCHDFFLSSFTKQ